MSLDALSRRRKEEELATWQRNLATLQGQAANHGTTPPIALVNEIETAQRNIKRIQDELDAGHEQSTEATVTGIIELQLIMTRRIDEQAIMMASIDKRLRQIGRRTSPGLTAQISRLSSVVLLGLLYTAIVIKEFRDAILANVLAASVIIVLVLALAGLLRVLANLYQPLEVGGDDQ